MSKYENLINADLLKDFKNKQDKELAPKRHTHTANDITDLQTIKGEDGQRGSQWFSGTAMSGTSTTTGYYSYSGASNALVGDYYLNTSYGYVYRCTTAGSGTTAKWTYQGSIRGAAGSNASITGGASTIASSNLTVNRAIISNASGKVAVSTVTSTELACLSGITGKVVGTTTGYNTKIHVSATEPTMSVGDIWIKLPS